MVEQHGLLDESLNYCMDYEYWLRLGKVGVRFGYMEEKLAGSRLYAYNKTLGAAVEVHKEINDMFKRLFGRVPDRWLINYAHVAVEQQTNRSKSPYWFMMKLLTWTVFAAWRWNRRVSVTMVAAIIKRRWTALLGNK